MSLKTTSPAPRLSFGFHLTLLYVGFLAVSFAILFTISYQMVNRVVQSRDRDVIRAKTEQFTTLYAHGGDAAIANYFSQQVNREPVFVRIIDRHNRVRFITVSHPLWNLLDEKIRQLDSFPDKSRWDELAREESEGSWMVATQPLGNGYFLQVGRSNSASRQLLGQLRATGLKILFPALLTSLLGGWLASRKTLAPLRALVGTTRHILETGDCKHRVPVHAQRSEMDTLGTMFNEVLDRNEELVERSRETLDNVAHDLRTPMTHLRNSAEHALQMAEPGERILREALADCMEESEQILQMLNTLMDLAEARAGGMELHPEPIALRELADEIFELYALVAEEAGIILRNEVPTYLTVEADRLRLRQCLANLADNAIKYSGSGGEVMFSGEVGNNQTTLSIHDQGCGIAQQEIDHIWNRLYRGEQNRSTPGLGLGLSMVKAITETHGGTIDVRSHLGEGTTFTLHLPRLSSLETQAQPKPFEKGEGE